MAYSAVTVFPAEVWADTRTDWLLPMQRIACKHLEVFWQYLLYLSNKFSFFKSIVYNSNITCSWKGSRVKGYVFAGSPDGLLKGANSWPGGTATSWVHESTVSNVWTVIRGADSTSLKYFKTYVMLECVVIDCYITRQRYEIKTDTSYNLR